MTKPEPEFTMGDLMQELQAQFPNLEGQVMTTTEMAEESGLSSGAILNMLRPLVNQGRIKVARKKISTLNGRRTTVTGWIIQKEE